MYAIVWARIEPVSRASSMFFSGGLSMKWFVVFAAIVFLLGGVSGADAGLVLTSAGQASGFGLSTFATGFPVAQGVGPIGIAFPAGGGVLVSDYPGNVRLFPTDTNGQNAASVPVAQNYGVANATGMAQVGGNIYMNQANNSQVVQLNGNGTFNQTIFTITNPPAPNLTGIAVDPANRHLFVSEPTTPGGSNQILDINPVTKTARVFLNSGIFTDGLVFNPSGTILYASTNSNSVTGFDTHTGAIVFGPVPVAGMPDSVALGTGSLAGNLFVNTNGGQIVELNLKTLSQTVIATGGSRGDLVYVDPHDGSLLVTQTNSIYRLTPPDDGGFYSPTPEPSTLAMSALGGIAFVGWAWRRRNRIRA
jgi:streptogramin lyase